MPKRLLSKTTAEMPEESSKKRRSAVKSAPKPPSKASPKKQRKPRREEEEEEAPDVPAPIVSKTEEPDEVVTRRDTQKMLNTMNYQKKQGNSAPWEMYQKCKGPQERRDFLTKYLADKKFTWVTVEVSHDNKTVEETGARSGWKSRFQIADEEKLPVDHPLMEALLSSLPAQAHSQKSWAEQGEMEYYYTSKEETKAGTKKTHSVKSKREAKLDTKVAKDFEDEFYNEAASSSQPALRAIVDGNIKDDAAEMTAAEKTKAVQKLLKDSKKLSAIMTHLQGQGFTTVAKLREVVEEKPFLHSLLEATIAACDNFNKARDEVVRDIHAYAAKEDSDVHIEKLKKILEVGYAHVDGFKSSSFQDARSVAFDKDKK